MDEQSVTTSFHSYPKLYAVGHRILANLLASEVIVEEKIDGSQISFGVFGGELKVRSRSVLMTIDAPEKMFDKGVEVIKALHEHGLLREGWTYRGEYLAKPKHNTLVYERTPANHIIGFDINDGHESYLSYEAKREEFARLGLETVPVLFQGVLSGYGQVRELLERSSCLGLQMIEGVVIKNYAQFGPDGKVLMGKFVSELFKEFHNGDWRDRNPTKRDILDQLIEDYTTPARWNKAIHRLRDAGQLEHSPRDIGTLVREIHADIKAECEDDIKERLFQWAWPQISRGVIRGFPQFYKERLLRSAFDESETCDVASNEAA